MFRSPSILSAIFLIATSLATPGLAAENLNRGSDSILTFWENRARNG